MAKPYRSTVVYDPEALQDFLTDVRSKEERKAAFNAVDKLRRIGEALAPPHMKPLQGEANLNELRPRQGRSPTRLIYRRVGGIYVVLAVAKDKADFEKKKRVAQERGRQYA
ncbi:MAG: type II toxin-antitoxin system RelE/ParE family toxin [Thermoleophilaceae bacterium]